MRRLAILAGGALLVLAALVAVTGGFQFAIGGLRVSATSAPRLFFEGAVVLLLSAISSRYLLAAIALFLIAAAADSETRRVGDGFEYLAMARNLSRAAPPSVTEAEATALAAEMATHGDRTWDGQLIPALRGADGRYDFPHFWVASLAAAPLVAVAGGIGLHPALGFTVMNLALVLGVCWLLVRAGAGLVAVLFAALLIWWIDKAHAEIFFAALVAGGLLIRARAPAAAIVMLAVASAQGPVLAALLVSCAVEALARHGARRPIVLACVAAAFLTAWHPLYYLWRLGIPSPLADTVIPHVPPLRALVTPLTDLNLGAVWFAPALSALTLAGAALALRRRAWDALPLAIGGLALLVSATQAVNVNHGGTPGMSRYGVWLLALLVPLAVEGMALLRWRAVEAIAAAGTVLFAAVVLHPRAADAGITPAPTPLASFVWTRVPALDNPLPEVFAERVAHQDGIAGLPIATPRCEKALLVATETGVSWPLTCEVLEVPPACAEPRAVCYANGGAILVAPLQPGFAR